MTMTKTKTTDRPRIVQTPEEIRENSDWARAELDAIAAAYRASLADAEEERPRTEEEIRRDRSALARWELDVQAAAYRASLPESEHQRVLRDEAGNLLSCHRCSCSACCPAPAQPSRFGPEMDAMFRAYGEGGEGKFWLMFGDELEEQEARVLCEYIANKDQIEAARDAAIAVAQRKIKVERVAIREGATRTKHGAPQIRRLAQPCKFLYNCQGTPARPTTLCVSTECWSHESGICPWAHPAMPKRAAMKMADGTLIPAAPARPADPEWHTEWQTDRLWRPVVAGENRFEFVGQRDRAGRGSGQAQRQPPRQQTQPVRQQSQCSW